MPKAASARDVAETVATAALCTLVVGLVEIGIDLARKRLKLDDKPNDSAVKPNEKPTAEAVKEQPCTPIRSVSATTRSAASANPARIVTGRA